jgi:hypothetical protein
MPRYYFDIYEGQSVRTDHLGMELPNPAAAEREARTSLTSTVSGLLMGGGDHDVGIEVRDGTTPLTRIVTNIKVHRF